MGTQVFGMAELLRLALDLAEARRPGAHPLLEVQIVGLRGRVPGWGPRRRCRPAVDLEGLAA